MHEHAGVSREELKQSAAVTVAVLLAVGLVAAWNVLIPGVDAWENIVAAVIGSLRLTGPVAAAFAAWVALRKRQALRGRSLTTWRALKAPLAIVVVVLGSFGATVLVLAIKTVLTEQSGRLSLSGLGMGMAGLALYSVIGWVAGWVLPRTFTPPLAGLACYGAFSWLADDRGWADKLAPGTGEPYDLFQGLSGAPFFDQTIWLLGLTAALLLGWAALVTRQAMVLACALLAVLAAGMGVSRVLTQTKPAAAEDIAYSCQEWPITVCVHPGMRAGLTELGAAFTQIASRLAGTPAAFTRVEQRPLEDELRPSSGLAPIHVPDLSAGFAEEAAYEYIESLAPRCPGTVAAGYREIVMAWLRGEPLPGGPLPEHQYAASWFSWLSEHQRREWLRMFFSDFQNCGLSSTHFGGGPARAQMAPTATRPTPETGNAYPVYPDPTGTMTVTTTPATPGSGSAPAMGSAPQTGSPPSWEWAPEGGPRWAHASAPGVGGSAHGAGPAGGGSARASGPSDGVSTRPAGWGARGTAPQGPHAGGAPAASSPGRGSGASSPGHGPGASPSGHGPVARHEPGASPHGRGPGAPSQGPGASSQGPGASSPGRGSGGPSAGHGRAVTPAAPPPGRAEAGWAPGLSGSGWGPAVVTESEMSPKGWH